MSRSAPVGCDGTTVWVADSGRIRAVDAAPSTQLYRSLLFARIVPCVKDIGLWGPKVQKAYLELGVAGMAANDLGELMKSDEDIAEKIDEEKRQLRARKAEVAEVVRLGAEA